VLLDLINNSCVLQDRSVVCEVDLLGLFGKELNAATGILIALLESLKRGGSLATESKALGDLCPVELKSCASLSRKIC
jgi:hypothetical protein